MPTAARAAPGNVDKLFSGYIRLISLDLARLLLVADPVHGSRNHQNDQEENGPCIDLAVAFTRFDWSTHRIAFFRFYG